MATVKDQVKVALQRLPDTCSMEDVQYQLYVIDKVQRGLAEVDRGRGVSHADAKKRLRKWLTK